MASPNKLDSLTSKFNKRRDQAWRSHMGTATRMRLSVTARMGSSEAVKIKMYSACFHAEGPPPMCADTSVMKRFPADRPLAALQDEVAAAFDCGDNPSPILARTLSLNPNPKGRCRVRLGRFGTLLPRGCVRQLAAGGNAR